MAAMLNPCAVSHPSTTRSGAPLHSLFDAENSLLPSQKFPARPSREFGVQSVEIASEISPKNRPGRAFLRKFPAKFPASREFRAATVRHVSSVRGENPAGLSSALPKNPQFGIRPPQ